MLELLVDLGVGTYKEAGNRPNHHPAAAAFGYFLLGTALGWLSVWLLPRPVLAPGPFPGISLILSPIAGGLVMALWGDYRRERGHQTTNLATWLGGGALALGISLARFVGMELL